MSGKDDTPNLQAKAATVTDGFNRLEAAGELRVFPRDSAELGSLASTVRLAKTVQTELVWTGDFQINKAVFNMSPFTSARSFLAPATRSLRTISA